MSKYIIFCGIILVVIIPIALICLVIHELGHLLVNRRLGILSDGSIRFSRKQFALFVSVDKCKLLALPKEKQILSFASGMMANMIVAAISLLLAFAFAKFLPITAFVLWLFGIANLASIVAGLVGKKSDMRRIMQLEKGETLT